MDDFLEGWAGRQSGSNPPTQEALPRGKDDAEDGEEQRKRLKKEKGKYNKPHKSFKF